jgi:hypothetical protein
VESDLVAALEEQADGGGLAADLGEGAQHCQQPAAQHGQVAGLVHRDQQRGQGGERVFAEPGECVGLVLIPVGVSVGVGGGYADAGCGPGGGQEPGPAAGEREAGGSRPGPRRLR